MCNLCHFCLAICILKVAVDMEVMKVMVIGPVLTTFNMSEEY